MENLVFCFFTAESEQSELLCLPGAVAQVTGIKGSNIVRVGEVRESLPRTTFEVNTANYQVHQSIKKVGWGLWEDHRTWKTNSLQWNAFSTLLTGLLKGFAVYNVNPKAFPLPWGFTHCILEALLVFVTLWLWSVHHNWRQTWSLNKLLVSSAL